tara:strand:+ start:2199 stop:3284 length:1086 start_codon:yes stop_codon:yes gene_type:complete
MGESNLIDYAKYLTEDIPEKIAKIHDHFTIEISIVMRKPRGHFSRAPEVIWDLLNEFGGGTFFQGQGYWEQVQEPVIYIMISSTGKVGETINKLKQILTEGQKKMKQQAVFAKINGFAFVKSLLSDQEIETFPEQMEFDEELERTLDANKSRDGENYKLIFGRIELSKGKVLKRKKDADKAQKSFEKSYNIWIELERDLLRKDGSPENERDLLKCYSNVLDPDIRVMLERDELIKTCKALLFYLPLNKDSRYGEDVLHLQAEARIRGNRINIFNELDLDFVSDDELICDGLFAIGQIERSLGNKKMSNSYLDRNPIDDIKTIIKQMNKIGIDEETLSKIKIIISRLCLNYPLYEQEIRGCI